MVPAVDPLEASDHFGPDPLRLFLVREIQYGQGRRFFLGPASKPATTPIWPTRSGTWSARITSMAARYRENRLAPSARSALPAVSARAIADYHEAMEGLRLHDGAAAAFRIVGAVNEFLTERAPWTLAKDPEAGEALDEALYEAAEATRIAAVLLYPVMPKSTARILERLGGADGDPIRFNKDAVFQGARALVTQTGEPLWPRLSGGRPGNQR